MRDASPLEFVPLQAEHFFAIEPQPSQLTQYGVEWADMDWHEAELYAGQPNCWTALRGDLPLAILGINPTFAHDGVPVQGVAWAVLGRELGAAHLAVTRFARDEVIGKCEFNRLEAIVRCLDIEPVLDVIPEPARTPHNLLAIATRRCNLTPQVRWALDVGFAPVALLRKFGAAAETHMLLERIR